MKKTPKSGIYAIKNKVNGKAYVGSAVDIRRRRREHLSCLKLKTHRNAKLQRAWEKYGESAFEFLVIENVEDLPKLIGREQFWIDKMGTAGHNSGYNICPVAGNCLGHKHGSAAKAKMSEARKGSHLSEETRLKISEAIRGERHPLYGKSPSEETRKKMSESSKGQVAWNKGIPRSDEVKAKLSLAGRGKRNYSKITPEQALYIRSAHGLQKDIAREFGIDQATVSKIKLGITWDSLPNVGGLS